MRHRIDHDADSLCNFQADLVTAMSTGKIPTRAFPGFMAAFNQTILCVTSTGRVAMVLGDVEVGDCVFAVRGVTMPFFLRPTTPDDSYSGVKERLGIKRFYKFVGGSYVHGIMDGEVFNMVDGTTLREECITPRNGLGIIRCIITTKLEIEV
jgi:hypothetical protein